MVELTRTTVVPSVELTERKLKAFKELVELYKQMLVELVDYGFEKNVDSFTRLKRDKYHELRERFPRLPSHYIHVACQDASTRIKSFAKLKKRGLAKSERPKVNRIAIWLDDHLWKRVGYTTILVSTHEGWVPVELRPHRQFWKYVNSEWALRTQPKMRLDYKKRRLLVYLVFTKSVSVNEEAKNVVSVDVNENNVTVKVLDKAYILETNIKRLTLGYAKYREVVQSVKGNGRVKRAVHGREGKRKKDIGLKIANIVATVVRDISATVVLEKLPKQCPRNMIKDVKNSTLRHRIYQAGFRGMVRAIEEKCFERGVPVAKVDPKGTSSRCPFCSSKLMRGHASRRLKCSKCGVEMGRDVAAVMNIERRYLTYKGLAPLAPMPCDPALEVAVLPVKEWARRKSLGATNENKLMRMSI